MQYEVHPSDQTQDMNPKVNGSFKTAYASHKKILKNQPEFSRTCGFRGDFTESLNFRFPPSKVTIPDLDFRRNPLKVEKRLKRADFGTVS